MLANLQIDEKLDWINEATTLDAQVARTKQVAQLDATFVPLMRMAVTETEKLCGIVEGMPTDYKPKTDIPSGISLTTVRQEYRRISKFVSGSSYTETTSLRREEIWLSIIGGLHWKEVNILVHIKDQTLLAIYPNMREVLLQLGMAISVPLVSVKLPIKKNTEKAPKTPKAPKAPKAPKLPKAPKAPKLPKAPKALEAPVTPKPSWFKAIMDTRIVRE